jgi:hypothetical protein
MANGPLGGFMPTPPAQGQPPQVSLNTSAESRGRFNNFLGTLPKNGALAPIQTGIDFSSSMPVSPIAGNINIFQPQMSQMAPMSMMPSAQPVQAMQQGGAAAPRQTEIMGQPHMLAYITPQEGGILKALGGSGTPGPMGIPQFGFGDGDVGTEEGDSDDEASGTSGSGTGPSESNGNDNEGPSPEDGVEPDESIVGDDPVAGIDFSPGPGIGGGSFDVVDTPTVSEEEQSINQGLGRGFMQGKGFTNISNVGPTSNLAYSPQFTADLAMSRGLDPSTVMSPDAFGMTTQGQAAAQAQMDDAMAIDQAINQAPASTVAAVAPSTYSPAAFGLGNIVDDPFGLGVVTGFGPMTDAMVSGMYGATANPQAGTQVAGPDLSAVLSGKPDNLTSISKGIDVTNPAEMKGLEDAIRDSVQVSLTMDDVNINTPAGQQMENVETAAMMSDVLSGRADAPYGIGQPVDVTTGLDVASLAPASTVDPFSTDRSPGMMNAVFGPEIASALGGLTVNEAMGLSGITDPSQTGTIDVDPNLSKSIESQIADQVTDTLGLNQNVAPAATTTSNVNPADFTGLMSSRDVAPASTTAPTTDSIVEAAIKDAVPSRSLSDILGAMNQKTDLQSQVAQSLAKSGVISGGRTSFDPDVETMQVSPDVATNQQISDMAQTIGPEVPSGFTDLGFGFKENLDDALTSNVPSVSTDTRDDEPVSDSTGISTVNTSPAPPGFEEQVGKPYSGTPIGQIESFYNAPTTMDMLGVPPGMINSALSVVENLARDQIATDLISGLYDPIVDRDGNITGSRNRQSGEVQSGMDMNAPDVDESSEPNQRIVIPKKPEEEKDPSILSLLGGTTESGSRRPTVVASPFTTSVGDFNPVGFDSGDLNKLIERITGVKSPRATQDRGVVNSIDNFLSKVA